MIENVTVPKEVEFEDIFDFEILVNKESDSNPMDVIIEVSVNNFKETFTIEQMIRDRELSLQFNGKNLKKGANDFVVSITYLDGQQKKYSRVFTESVHLTNVNMLESMQISYQQLNYRLENLAAQEFFLIIIGIMVVFILVIWFIFRKVWQY